MQHVIGLKSSITTEPDNRPDKLCMEKLAVKVLSNVGAIDFIWKLIADGQTNVFLVIEILWVEGMRVVILAICHPGVQLVIRNRAFRSGLTCLITCQMSGHGSAALDCKASLLGSLCNNFACQHFFNYN